MSKGEQPTIGADETAPAGGRGMSRHRAAGSPRPSTSTGEAFQFWVLGTVAVIGALGTVAA